MRLHDLHQIELDNAHAKYRRAYNRGYNLSERGEFERAQRILLQANAELANAKRLFEAKTGRIAI